MQKAEVDHRRSCFSVTLNIHLSWKGAREIVSRWNWNVKDYKKPEDDYRQHCVLRHCSPIVLSNCIINWRRLSSRCFRRRRPLLARSLPRIISGVLISNYEYSGELFGGSNFELLACIFVLPSPNFELPFKRNYERTFLLFQGVINIFRKVVQIHCTSA